MSEKIPAILRTEYGFTFFNASVEGMAFDEKGNKTISIKTQQQELYLRVTADGLIKIVSHKDKD